MDRSKSNIPNYPSTHAIEKCKCPSEYSGLSCQRPNEGYYRYYPKEKEEYNWVDRIIGIAKPCECNQKSSQCDPDSGYCQVRKRLLLNWKNDLKNLFRKFQT